MPDICGLLLYTNQDVSGRIFEFPDTDKRIDCLAEVASGILNLHFNFFLRHTIKERPIMENVVDLSFF